MRATSGYFFKVLGLAALAVAVYACRSAANALKSVRVFNLLGHGSVPYADAWRWQQELLNYHVSLQNDVNSELAGSVLILEHDPVYTLGTATTEGSGPFCPSSKELPFDSFEVERAGEATYHGPGQLVVYPILDLSYFEKDINLYLRRMEQVVIDSILKVAPRHLQADQIGRMAGLTGVWVDDEKIAAMGIKLRRWVTMHGISVNVNPDMAYFGNIVPCGIRDKGVTSLHKLGVDMSLQGYSEVYWDCFQDNFEVDADILNSKDSLKVLELLDHPPELLR